MRLAGIVLRDVKSKHFALQPRFPLPFQHARRNRRDTWLSAGKVGEDVQRYFSTTLLNDSENPVDVLLSELSDSHRLRQRVQRALAQPNFDQLVQKTGLFRKWAALLTDPVRLAIESDFLRHGPAKTWPKRLLVDTFKHRGDLALWSCLLNYQKRVNGDSGVRHIWKALWGRKTLYDVQSPLAPIFWQTILDAAVRSDDVKFLEYVWIYSEWMYDLHGVRWPQLYSTVLSHFLRTRQHQQALQWQLRLTPNFYPGVDEFARIVKRFADDQELYHPPTLESLYIVNSDHQLYDTLIPYLYNLGASQLAAKWRRICIRHDDIPSAHVPVRPFLRFLQGYFPHESLHPSESVIFNRNIETTEDAEHVELSREFINRVHGGTFGISVKNYNDNLGAKWLASSWISLNIAISTIAALGIEHIGPLSLQSIALREGTSKGVLSRIEQLKEQGITVVDSSYLRLVLYLARMRDDQLLLDLLNCDLHPDVFDDHELQAQLIASTATSGDWQTHRLVLVSRLVAMKEFSREAANALARVYVLRRDRLGLSTLLTNMKSMEIVVNQDVTSLIFDNLVTEAKSTYLSEDSLYFYLPICRQLASMEIPAPVRCWRKILFCLTRQSRLDDLEKVCVELVNLFTSPQTSRPGFTPVHLENIPEPMKKPLSGVKNLLGVYVPVDLPTQAPLHPLHQIFERKLLRTIVRYSFYTFSDQQGESVPDWQIRRCQPGGFNGGRVIRLLRILCDQGLFIQKKRLVTAVKLRLITLYGPGYPAKKSHQLARARNTLTLSQMKSLLDEAWGEEFLPPIEILQAEIETRGRKEMLKNMKYIRSIGKTIPRLDIVL
ncbi:uncharacterized protein GGS22DRAFT_173507 [Annulohypoxylon maeteangense]|uniref:uncharacterized protein n=1 Tax=Annulohypoxylon maeteangense TaxID=1927788 RepID=UPI002008A502|nr:uncharacterized protein GGS22DRAFT_173507 [Annulohypoxylon maeteangense]KAI0881156.1 hypothetical protein GGS22DRAFT_173507 [Annulohypoxylon maeteangense]